MKCNEVQELLGLYRDLPEDSENKRHMDEHIQDCASCQEEFKYWKESGDIIQLMDFTAPLKTVNEGLPNRVMSRIYDQESWRTPISERVYSFSFQFKRNAMAVISFFLLLFTGGFLYSFMQGGGSQQVTLSAEAHSAIGIQPVASASGTVTSAASTVPNGLASLSDLPMFSVGPIHTFPHYLIALSFLGLTSTLLIMNWLSRTNS